MKNKTVLITGATDGIGLQTVREMGALGANLILHGRNPAKLEKAMGMARGIQGVGDVKGFLADLASLQDIKRMVGELRSGVDRIDVLINNAGVFMNRKVLSKDGYEMTFAVNHLAPFALTLQLMDRILAGSPSRIVNVSSMAHQGAVMDPQNLQGEKDWSPFGSYGLSKLCNILFTMELSRRLEGTDVVTHALHPGVITTKLLTAGFGNIGSPLDTGARTVMMVATDPEVGKQSGNYYSDRREKQPSREATDRRAAEQLWEISEKLSGVGLEIG